MNENSNPANSINEKTFDSLKDNLESTHVFDPQTDLPWKPEKITVGEDPDCHFVLVGNDATDRDGFFFEIGKSIGGGGFGEVFTARQVCLNREVALKRIKEPTNTEEAKSQLENEAALMGKLDHPNIPPVHLLARDVEGNPIAVMKRIQGESWHTILGDAGHTYWDRVQTDRLAWNLRVFLQICNAVEYAHSKNVLHLDIKPQNVMLGYFGEVYLIDWGLAQLGNTYRDEATHGFAGTPGYAAPEMFEMADPLTVQTDIFVLGATLMKVVCGKPFRIADDWTSLVHKAEQHLTEELPAETEPQLREIIGKATRYRPQDRYPSVRALAEAIENYLELRAQLKMVQTGLQRFHELKILLLSTTKPIETPREIREEVHRRALECRFLFEQVLRDRPDLPEAREGFFRVLEILAGYEIGQGKLENALNLINELDAMNLFPEDVAELRENVSQASLGKVAKKELETQIQYRLIEELHDLTDKQSQLTEKQSQLEIDPDSSS